MSCKLNGSFVNDIKLNQSGTLVDIMKVMYNNAVLWERGDNRFVAITDGGGACALEDGGSSWTSLSSAANVTFTAIAHGNNRFVAVGSVDTGGDVASYSLADFATSSTAWTRLTGLSGDFKGVAYGNGRFIAVGNSGVAYELVDNSSQWDALTTTAITGNLRGVAYGNGRFVAVSENGTTYKLADSDSTDTWVKLTGSGGTLYAVAYGNGRFVATGSDGSTYKLTDNNDTWESIKSSTISSTFNSVAYGNGRFVIVGNSGAAYKLVDDTWTSLTDASGTLRSVSYGNGRFVTVGDNGNNGVSYALSDGSDSWGSSMGPNRKLYGIAYGGSN